MTQHADQALPGSLLLFLQGLAYVGKQQQCVRCTILAKRSLAQQPARRFGAKRVNALVGRGEQIVQLQFAGGTAKATKIRRAQQLHTGHVD